MIAALLWPCAAAASGYGWYYESFSWPTLTAYFGQGSVEQRRAFRRHIDEVVAEEAQDHFFMFPRSAQDVALWRGLVDRGLDYAKLGRSDARAADRVVFMAFNGDMPVPGFDVRPETTPDFMAPVHLRALREAASPRGRRLLDAFRFGRSLGQPERRDACLDRGDEWTCYDAYVVLSPEESRELARELRTALPHASDIDAFGRQCVQGWIEALERTAGAGRGMFLHASD